MTEQEKRTKVKNHNAKRRGYLIKMLLSLGMIMVFFKLAIETDEIVSVLCFVMMLVSGMVVLCFKMLHQSTLFCPLCGKRFGYINWMTRSMPYRCPRCGEKMS